MHRTAVKHLRASDPTMARIIEAVGTCRFRARAEGTHFDAVVRSIVYQQLSTKAAATIHGRVLSLFDGRDPLPAELLAVSDDTLRGVGLSRQKIGYLRDLAERAANGDFPLDTLHELEDQAVMEALTAVKGVGRWTAQMFLMFRLGRPNILPELDLGIRKAIMVAYGFREMPTSEEVHRIGAPWAPHATIASWYLWRSLELPEPVKPVRRRRARRA
jgi:3-methyladenine DNA glycosylase/8-oxoguanine DNA glycosylase